MIFVVSWDGPSLEQPQRGCEVAISTEGEFDQVLDRVRAQAAAEGLPYGVQVHQPGQHGAVMLGVGHPDRSFIDWLDRSRPHGLSNRHGMQPDLAPAPGLITFDVYGDWTQLPPQRTRMTPTTARVAAHEYLSTRQRPTCIQWTGPAG